MKKILCFIFIFHCSLGFSQSKWTNFISTLTELKLPLKIDSNTIVENVMTSKNDAMNFLILPASRLNLGKPDSLQFEIDTSLINAYKQWDSLDLNKKDTIDIYSPIGGGLIFCYKKIKISSNLDGLIWLFYRNMGKERGFMYTYGIEYWLFLYDKKGECKDFIQIAKKQSVGMCDKCLFYKECTLKQTNKFILTLTFSQVDISPKEFSDFFDENPIMTKSMLTSSYILTDLDVFKEK